VEWARWEEGPGLETGGLLRLGGYQGAPKGANGYLQRIARGLDRGSRASSEEAEDSTIRE